MKLKYTRIFFWLLNFCIVVSILMPSCSPSRLDKSNYNLLYNRNLGSLHPALFLQTYSNDSSHLFVKLPAGDLLYQKSATAFESRFWIWYGIYPNIESSQLLDSATYNFTDVSTNTQQELTIPIKIKTPARKNYLMHVKVFDLNRGKFAERNIDVVNNSSQSANTFALYHIENKFVPVLDNFLLANKSYFISNNIEPEKQLYIRYFKDDFPVAAVPFKTNGFVKFSYAADSTYLLTNRKQELHFDKFGMYHFQFDTTLKEGYTAYYFNNDYPSINKLEQMTEPIRYLITNEEYTKLMKADDTKKAVDDFWLQCAGNEERASKLVSAYYNRVQKANEYFVSFTQGWKTDRGMVYIIFGAPEVVYKSNNTEMWEYQSDGNDELRFTFKKINNPFSENDFQLIRSVSYEVNWYRAVEKWRAGRL
ncbi:MAG: GWxTD domain-containing protein [Bacteroidetes bacterium]|nr:GWxTD domain-containing protein [Bacteroidota bacterium]